MRRTFISVDVPDLEGIDEFAERVCGLDGSIRGVDSDCRHLTLKFLGDVTEGEMGEIADVLRSVAAYSKPFNIAVSGTGVFPNKHYIKVVWVGFRGTMPIMKLARDIDGALSKIGFEEEGRAYMPHLTVARVNWIKDKESLIDEVDSFQDTSFGEISVGCIKLMTSELTPSGPIYTTVAEIPLGEENQSENPSGWDETESE